MAKTSTKNLFIIFAVLIALLLLAPLNAPPAAGAPQNSRRAAEPLYQIYAIRYGTLKAFPLRGLVYGPGVPDKRINIALIFWVVKGGGHTILFDCGFYRQQFMRAWHPADYIKPTEVISKLGLKPDDITDIVISHAHWDHMDAADLFPHAQIWIQKGEFEYYDQPAHDTKADDVWRVDMLMLEKLKAEGRLHLIDGDNQQIFPGIIAYTGGRHTYASEYLGIHTRKGTVVLASDNVYLYMNLEKHLPIAETFDDKNYAANLKAQDRMRKIASSPNLIIPGHDPLEFVKFPKPGNGVARIA